MLEKSRILLGVTGGVAAYKAIDLASRLTARGATVRTVLTEAATQLVTPQSFQAVTASDVYTSLWRPPEDSSSAHIALVDWAQLIVVAPATANIIGKMANGICDDLLSTLLCAGWSGPILVAPAMNDRMWANPAVQRNVATIQEAGVQRIGPVEGRLACGSEGAGRMAEPQDILARIEQILSKLPDTSTP